MRLFTDFDCLTTYTFDLCIIKRNLLTNDFFEHLLKLDRFCEKNFFYNFERVVGKFFFLFEVSYKPMACPLNKIKPKNFLCIFSGLADSSFYCLLVSCPCRSSLFISPLFYQYVHSVHFFSLLSSFQYYPLRIFFADISISFKTQ